MAEIKWIKITTDLSGSEKGWTVMNNGHVIHVFNYLMKSGYGKYSKMNLDKLQTKFPDYTNEEIFEGIWLFLDDAKKSLYGCSS